MSRRNIEVDDRYAGKDGHFVSLESEAIEGGPAKSVEGWVIFVRGLHEESQEDDVYEAFADFGPITNIHVNIDRRTGFIKGYALVEYNEYQEALEAKRNMNGASLLGKKIEVDFAVKKPRHS